MAAGNATIGSLQVVLGADTANFETGLKKAALSLGAFAVIGGKVADEIIKAFHSITEAIPKAIEGVEKLGKASERLGIGVEALSGLAYAAYQSDISLEQLTKGVEHLGRAMIDAGKDKTGEAAAAFQALGISLRDNVTGKMKSAETVVLEMADAYKTHNDGAAKVEVNARLMGKGMGDVIPWFNKGAASIKGFSDEQAKWGGKVSSEFVEQAGKYSESIKKLNEQNRISILTFTEGMLPAINELLDVLVKLGNNTNFKSWGEEIAKTIRSTTYEFQLFVTTLSLVSSVWGAFKDSLKSDAAEGGPLAAIKDALKTYREEMEKIRDLHMKDEPTAKIEVHPAKRTDLNLPDMEGAKALDTYLKGLAKRKAALEADYVTVGLGVEAHQRMKVILEAEAVAGKKLSDMSPEQQAKIVAMADAFGKLSLQLEIANERWNLIKGTVTGAFSKFEDALISFADGSKTAKEAFTDMAKGIITSLARMIIQMQITLPLARALNNVIGSMFNASLPPAAGSGGLPDLSVGFAGLSGARAGGGPVMAGKSYLVGEHQPELFVPKTSGTILPSVPDGGGVVNNISVINNAGAKVSTTSEKNNAGGSNIQVLIEQIQGAIAGDISNGQGSVHNAMRGRFGLQPST